MRAAKLAFIGVLSDDPVPLTDVNFFSIFFDCCELSAGLELSESNSVSRLFDLPVNIVELRSNGLNASNNRAILRAVFCNERTRDFMLTSS